MNVIALMSWYREDPAWLYRAVTSLKHIPDIRHLVALDGAYALFPDAEPRSTLDEVEAIHQATRSLGIGLTLHQPAQPWAGQECEKRTSLFRYGDQVARPGDWFLILDADEEITRVPDDFTSRLTALSTLDVAEVTFEEPGPFGAKRYPIPILFRAIPGITVQGNHYTYVTPDGRKLWGNAVSDRLEPRVDLTSLIVRHYAGMRGQQRRDQAKTYYSLRDEQGIERGQCLHCNQRATRTLPGRWTRLASGDCVADWVEVCDQCAPGRIANGIKQLRWLGVPNPEQVTLHSAPGANPIRC